MARNTQESIHYLSRGSEQRQVLWLHHSASHPSSDNAARIAACVSFCRAPKRACGRSFRTACHHGSFRKFVSTRIRMKAPMSSKLLRTRSPPGALAFSLIGSKFSTDRKMPRFNRRFVSVAKKPSTALSQDADVGVKWKVQPTGGRTAHPQAHAQSVRRDTVRPMGGEPVLPVFLRGNGVPARGAIRSLVADALAPAAG